MDMTESTAYGDIEQLFSRENQFMALKGYWNDEISKAQRIKAIAIMSQNDADAQVNFLAMCYLDYLLSRVIGELDDPRLKLITIICLFLARYMKSKTIDRKKFMGIHKDMLEMVMEILYALKFRLRHVTSFCFIPYFVSLLKSCHPLGEDDIKISVVYSFIHRTHHDIIESTQYKPSIKAACAVLAALECSTTDKKKYLKTIAASEFIKEEDLCKCFLLTVLGETEDNKELNTKQKKPVTVEFTSENVADQTEHHRGRDALEEFDLAYPLGGKQNCHGLTTLFDVESDYMPAVGYWANEIAASQRRIVIDFVKEYYPSIYSQIPFLAVTYFDYYFSRNPKASDTSHRLFKVCALSCLSLASTTKSQNFVMNKSMIKHLDVQESEILHMRQTIKSALGGRLRPVTAFGFVDYFVSMLNLDDESRKRAKTWANLYFLESTRLDFVEFSKYKPSIHAASAILDFFRGQEKYDEFVEKIASNDFVNEGDLRECIQLTISIIRNGINDAATPMPPQAYMELIREAGGAGVELVIEKKLTASDVNKKENRMLIPRNQVIAKSFLTKEEEDGLMATEARMEDVPLIQPNLQKIEVTFKLRKKSSYVLCNKWRHVFQKDDNQLGEGTKVQIWCYRVKGKLELALVKLPEGRQ